jgi:hypothetical protein
VKAVINVQTPENIMPLGVEVNFNAFLTLSLNAASGQLHTLAILSLGEMSPVPV